MLKMGFSKLFICTLIFIFLSNLSVYSVAYVSINNITLLGDAYLQNNGRICLTPYRPSPSSSHPSIGVGRALYNRPIRFLDPSTNSNASFEMKFSFYIIPSSVSGSLSSPPQFGDGLTFLITSNQYNVGKGLGYIGLSNNTPEEEEEFYFAVEFDTSLNPGFGDSSDNHVGIDINSLISFASVDSTSMDFDLKNSKRMTVWIEYIDSKKIVKVWLSYTKSRTISPILATHIDLSGYFEEFMFIGFSASNGKFGSPQHVIDQWEFRSYGFLPNLNSYEIVVDGGCFACDPGHGVGGCIVGVTDDAKPKESGDQQHRKYEIVLGVGGAALLFIVLLVIGFIHWYFIRNQNYVQIGQGETAVGNIEMGTSQVPIDGFTIASQDLERLSLDEVKIATRDFETVLGVGISGAMYGGHLASGEEVTVKRFYQFNTNNVYCEPVAVELVATISSLKHKNLLQLQGWCCERGELILVYEYMPKGSLEKLLEKTGDLPGTELTWEDRKKIVLGVSSALTYLHEECERQIIHRDVKACNIMLDADFTAKLGDFGLMGIDQAGAESSQMTVPAGTRGYLAPELNVGVATVKTDVFSFGVVALEVATGRRPIDNDGGTLVDWVWGKWINGRLIEAADAGLMGRFNEREMEGMLMVGLSCTECDSTRRPTVKEAAKMLKGETPLPILPARRPLLTTCGCAFHSLVASKL